VCQVGCLQGLYRDVRSTEHKILSMPVYDVYADHIKRAKYLALNATVFFSNLFLTCLHAIYSYNPKVYKTRHFDVCQHSDVHLKGKSTR